MRSPTQIIWNVIGDIFGRSFRGNERRSIDLFWQGLFESAKDTFEYVNFYQQSNNIFTTKTYAPWGTYKVDLAEVDEILSGYGFVIGGKNVSDRWRWVNYTTSTSIPNSSGLFGIFNSGLKYDLRKSIPLQSGGQILEFTGAGFGPSEIFNEQSTSSYVFSEDTVIDGTSRWSVSGSRYPEVTSNGIRYNPQWVNWSILSDNYHISGNKSWNQKWIATITKWDKTDKLRAISLVSQGDIDRDFEVRLYDSGNEVKVAMGKFGKTRYEDLFFLDDKIRRLRGSFLFDGFEKGQTITIIGSDYDGSYLITDISDSVITVDGSYFGLTETPQNNAILTASLEIGDGDSSLWQGILENASEANPVDVEFVINYDAVNALIYSEVWINGNAVRQITPYRVGAGRRSHIFDVFNQYKEVDVYLKYIVSTGDVWEYTSNLDLNTSWGDSYKFVYESEEPIVSSSIIRTEAFDLGNPAELISWDGSTMVVEIDEDWNGYASQYIRLEYGSSWATFEKINQNNNTAIYSKIESNDVNFKPQSNVKLTPLFLREDEFQWIDAGLLTTQFRLPITNVWSIDTLSRELDMYERYGSTLGLDREEDSERYLNKIKGYQIGIYSPPSYSNIRKSVGLIVGAPYVTESGVISSIEPMGDYDSVFVGAKEYKIDPFWRMSGLLKKKGQFISQLDLMINGINVDDYKSNYDLVKKYVSNIWRSWGTFVVRIPAILGSDTSSIDGVVRLLKRIKNKRTDFIVRFESSSQEDFRDGYSENYVNTVTDTSYAHTIEDAAMFDDGGAVVMNGTNYQTIGSFKYSEEYQLGLTQYLDDGLTLDQFNQLGTYLSVNDVRKKNDGSYIYRYQGIDVKRDLSVGEEDLDLSKVRLRVSPTRGDYNARETLWTIDPNTDNFLSPHIQDWSLLGFSTSSKTFCEIYESRPSYVAVVSNSGEAFVSSNYFHSWHSHSIGSTDGLTLNPRRYAWFLQKTGVILVSDFSASAPTTPATYGFTAPSTLEDFVGACWYGDYGWIVSTNGTNINVFISNDQGQTWSVAVLVDSGSKTFVDIQFIDENIGFIFLNDKIYKSSDGGSTWLEHSIPSGVQCGYAIDEERLLIGTSTDLQQYNNTDGWTSVLGVSDDIRRIDGLESRISICGDGVIYHSHNYGESFSLAKSTAGVLDDISIAGNNWGLASGQGAIYRYY